MSVMTKNWEDLTDEDKIESLHHDVTRLFQLVKDIQAAVAQDQSALKSQIDVMKPWGPLLNSLMKRIEQLGG
jgi:hypothetical protein